VTAGDHHVARNRLVLAHRRGGDELGADLLLLPQVGLHRITTALGQIQISQSDT